MQGKLITPVSAVPSNKKFLDSLISEFAKLGHKINTGVLDASKEAILMQDEQGLANQYKQIQRDLKAADFIVAEISEPSSGVGYLLSQSVSEKKPVLVLMKRGTSSKPPLPLQVNPTKLVSFHEYSDEKDIPEIIRGFLAYIKDIIDTKFILIISPQIDKYLEWAASEKRMHKAQIVREAIEDMMNKDKDYKGFIKQQESL